MWMRVYGHQPDVARGWSHQGPGYLRADAAASAQIRGWRVLARAPAPEPRPPPQVFVPGKDGTRIPMFIVARKNLTLDGSHPTFLYAYGGAPPGPAGGRRPSGPCGKFSNVGGVRLSAQLSNPLSQACVNCFDRRAPRLLVLRHSRLDGAGSAAVAVLAPTPRRARRAGFDITMFPTFSTSRLVFLRAFNGVYAIAGIRCAGAQQHLPRRNVWMRLAAPTRTPQLFTVQVFRALQLHAICVTDCADRSIDLLTRPAARRRRGGGEYGLDWWEGGRLHKKQNGFDDFASCAQFLHSAGYSSPAKLTIEVRRCPAWPASLHGREGCRELYVTIEYGIHSMVVGVGCDFARGRPRARLVWCACRRPD